MTDLIYFDLAKDGSITTTTDITTTDNELAVIESVGNIMSTQPFNRIFNNRDFGMDLGQYLFDPIDVITANAMMDTVENAILNNEPRVKNLDIEITPDEDANTFIIDIKFFIDQSDRQLNINTTLERLR